MEKLAHSKLELQKNLQNALDHIKNLQVELIDAQESLTLEAETYVFKF